MTVNGTCVLDERTLIYHSLSDQETLLLGLGLGALLEPGDVVGLAGELGCGKTWFCKGLALGLGVPPDVTVTSPSFALVQEYAGRCKFIHMDAYRIESLAEFFAAGMEECLHQHAVAALEWADRWPGVLPDRSVTVEIEVTGETSRKLTLRGHHPRSKSILDSLERKMNRS